MQHFWTRRSFFSTLIMGAGFECVLARNIKIRWPYRLGIITDELSQDLEKALQFLTSQGLGYCELREIWNQNIMNLSAEELDRARRIVQKYRLRVHGIASPIFKYDLPGTAPPERQRDIFRATFADADTDGLLHRAFDIARMFSTNRIRIFSYWRVEDPQTVFPKVRDRLAQAARIAGQNRMTLMLENEHTCNVGTGKELGQMLRAVNSPHLRGNWDPANAALLGEVSYPDGYREVQGLFDHMHVKDFKKDLQTGKPVWLPLGEGMIDYVGQFRALQRDRYAGTMSVETSYRRPDGDAFESNREFLEGLRKTTQKIP